MDIYENQDERLLEQKQKMVNAQKILELQNQDTRNFTLGGLLSCLETIAFRYDPKFKKKYDGYNPKSFQDKKNIIQLITQLRIESKAFRLMYEECIDKYNNYWFPDNLSKKDLLNDIKKWKHKIPAQYQIYYDNIINLFEGNMDDIYFPKINSQTNNQKASCDPNLQIKTIPPNIAYINLRRKLVKKQFLQNQKFDNTLKLYMDKHCDSTFEEMNERYRNLLEKHNELCTCDICVNSADSIL